MLYVKAVMSSHQVKAVYGSHKLDHISTSNILTFFTSPQRPDLEVLALASLDEGDLQKPPIGA